MKKQIFGIALFCLLLLQTSPVLAMQHLPVELNFNTPEERAKWSLSNTVDTVPTQWVIGKNPDYAYGDDYMLYLSPDGGKTRAYTPSDDKSNYQCIAYYPLDTLPAGEYELRFHMRGLSPVGNAYYTYISSQIVTGESGYSVQNSGSCYNSADQGKWWRWVSIKFSSDGTTNYVIRFNFYNRNSKLPTQPNQGYAIDGIQIYPVSDDPYCSQIPQNMQMTRNSNDVIISWAGNASEYQLEYFMNDTSDNRHYRVDNITTLSHTLHSEQMQEGTYTFRVRAICGNDTSGWAAINYQLVYDITKHCMDYLNFSHPDVKPQTGSFSYPWGSNGAVDKGFLSDESRHTKHHYPRDYDARTKYKLRTFPEGQPAAIRLGNWQTGAQAEDIVYTMQVSPDMPVLQLRYALVMQLPGHKEEQQPRFTLEFLDSVGVLIDSCAFVDFTASADLEGWNTVHEEGQDDIIWKDWTLIGLNMREYVGRTIQIRITAKDCSEGKHFGYAYFTLACPRQLIQGIHCGVKPDSFVVEEGFKYRWYRKYDTPQTVLGTDRVFRLTDPQDTATYCVDMINMLDTSCYFSMDASSLAFIPHAAGGIKYIPSDCKNYIQLVDSSSTLGVYWQPDGTKVVVKKNDGAEDLEWDLGPYGTFSGHSPKISIPDAGDELHVVLRTYMENRLCEDSMVFDYTVPAVGAVRTVNTHYFCRGGSAVYNGKIYTEEVDFSDTITSWTGCDSISTMALRYFQMDTIDVYDTLCTGGAPLQWYGQTLSQPGEYFATVRSNVYDCDSVFNVMHLHLQPLMQMALNYTPQYVCGGTGTFDVPFSVTTGTPSTYDLIFSDAAKQRGFTDRYGVPVLLAENKAVVSINEDVWAGLYDASIIFHNIHCDSLAFPLAFSVYYNADELITQRWNDFLSVRQSAFDLYGGFTDYQWYKDGEPITGQTGSQLYLPEEGLQTGSGYSVELTRQSDGERVHSCPFYPTVQPNSVTLTVYPTVLSAQRRTPLFMHISQDAQVRLYYQTGVQVAEWQVHEGDNQLTIPSERGLYMLHVITAGGERKIRKIIVE